MKIQRLTYWSHTSILQKIAYNCLLHCIILIGFAPNLLHSTPSNFKITGKFDVTCNDASYEYRSTWESNNEDAISSEYQWRWHVDGGKFENGKTELVQVGNESPMAKIYWYNYSNYAGKISLSLYIKDELLGSSIETVRIGLQHPHAIQIEDGPMSCEGNWFVLKSDMPFDGTETVEWTVSNGLDINEKPLQALIKQGIDAHRIYLIVADQKTPLKVSARVKSGCAKSQAVSPTVSDDFEYSNTRLLGKETIEQGASSSYGVCLASGSSNGKKTVIWQSTGTIEEEGNSTVTVKFDKVGIQEVSMLYADCSGELKTVKKYVRVISKDGIEGQPSIPNKFLEKNRLGCKVYPNPVSGGTLNIEMDSAQDGQLYLIGLQGEILCRKEITEKLTKLDVKNFSSGIYFLRVVSSAGEFNTKVNIN